MITHQILIIPYFSQFFVQRDLVSGQPFQPFHSDQGDWNADQHLGELWWSFSGPQPPSSPVFVVPVQVVRRELCGMGGCQEPRIMYAYA